MDNDAIASVARARMTGILVAIGVPENDRPAWEQLSDLDRATSTEIARTILDTRTVRFLPVDAHDLFLARAPQDHRDAVPYDCLPHHSQFYEEEGVRAAMDEALRHEPENARLRRLRDHLAIEIACETLHRAVDYEMENSTSTQTNMWGNIAERALSAFTLHCMEIAGQDDLDPGFVTEMVESVQQNALQRVANVLSNQPVLQ